MGIGRRPGQEVRIDGDVAVEVAFQRGQMRKRQAMQFYAMGNFERANRRLQQAAVLLAEVLVHASAVKRAELEAEITLIVSMERSAAVDANLASKALSISVTGSSRFRRRRGA